MNIRVLFASVALTALAGTAFAHDDPTYQRSHVTHTAKTPEYITPNTYTAGPAAHIYTPHYQDPGIVVISRKTIRARNGRGFTPATATSIYNDPTAGNHSLPRTQIYNN